LNMYGKYKGNEMCVRKKKKKKKIYMREKFSIEFFDWF
jgi:hypothetical protein